MTKMSVIRLTLLFLMLIILGVWVAVILSNSNPEEITQKAQLLEAIYKKGNYIEAGLWGIFAIGFTQAAIKNTGKIRTQRIIAAVTFLLFGLSDIVEVQTGAWWHPWWLFLWKSLCVISMVILLTLHLRKTRLS
ncbi:MAG: hypothetical protein WBA77_10185 [Microcoleaceae cyanobacterium]